MEDEILLMMCLMEGYQKAEAHKQRLELSGSGGSGGGDVWRWAVTKLRRFTRTKDPPVIVWNLNGCWRMFSRSPTLPQRYDIFMGFGEDCDHVNLHELLGELRVAKQGGDGAPFNMVTVYPDKQVAVRVECFTNAFFHQNLFV